MMEDGLLGRFAEAVRAHYDDPSRASTPLLLSRFGQLHPQIRKELVDRFGSLSAAIAEAGEGRLVVVTPSGAGRGGEAVAPADRRAEVERAFVERASRAASVERSLDAFPLALRLAFCVKTQPTRRVAVRLAPSCHFTRLEAGEAVPPGMVLVEDEYRRPGINLRDASPAESEALLTSMSAWASAHGLDVMSFVRPSDGGNALTRLLAAQPRGIVSQLVIPGDIAELLSRHD